MNFFSIGKISLRTISVFTLFFIFSLNIIACAESGPGSGIPGGYMTDLSEDFTYVEAARKSTKPQPVKQPLSEVIIPEKDSTQTQPQPQPPTTIKETETSLTCNKVVWADNTPLYPVLRFRDSIFKFTGNPIKLIDGNYYINVSDPDFQALFDKMGLTYTWFSYSGKLFIYLPTGSVSWQVQEDYAMLGGRQVKTPLTARKYLGNDYLPLDTLALLLNLQVIKGDNLVEIRPSLQINAGRSAEEDTIDIRLSAASDLACDIRYQANPPAVRFTIPKTAYIGHAKKLFIEGVQIRVNNTVEPDKLYVTMEFPPHWKGEIAPTSHKNLIVVRMKPNINYSWGIRDELLKSIRAVQSGDQIRLLFTASNYVKYYWSYDPDEGVLYVDVPFSKPVGGLSTAGCIGGPVESCQVGTYCPDGINITRVKLELSPGSAFTIGQPEDGNDTGFALLAGPKDTISTPSPYVGQAGIVAVTGRKLIVIDPGHGGSDSGACNHAAGFREKDITLDISKKLAENLTALGYRVILTRYRDVDLTYPGSPDADELQARADVANNNNADLFVSIHCNASTSKDLKGSSYHWYKDSDRKAAEAFRNSLGPNIGTREIGLRHDKFYVLSHTKAPSVLVETAFISNSEDIKILASDEHRWKIAQQLVKSIDYFFNSDNLAKTLRQDFAGDE